MSKDYILIYNNRRGFAFGKSLFLFENRGGFMECLIQKNN